MNRVAKRQIIIGIYVFAFIMLISGVYMITRPDPTCFDGKLNQNEKNIDCGGVCAPCPEELIGKDLVVTNATVVYGGENAYDVIAEVHNPNPLFGGKKVFYTMTLTDVSGKEIASRRGETFILPNENKYLVQVNIEAMDAPSDVDVSVDRVDWVQFTNFDSPQIVVRNQRFGLIDGPLGYAEAIGLVSNESPYDFHNVIINVILLDERGVPIAANTTVQNTLEAHSKREFRLTWPDMFPGTITSTEMQAEANVFDSLNFMEKYIPVSE
jgi:hypothetical protein